MRFADPQQRKRLILLAGGGGAMAVILAILAFSGPPADGLNADEATIVKAEGKKDTARLAAAVSSPDEKVARRAIEALANVGGESAAPAIQPALNDSRAGVREEAVVQLGHLGPAAQSTFGALRQVAARDPSPQVRAAAVLAMGRLQVWDATRPLLAALEDRESMVRRAAVQGIDEMLVMRVRFDADGSPELRRQQAAEVRNLVPRMKKKWEHWRQQVASGPPLAKSPLRPRS